MLAIPAAKFFGNRPGVASGVKLHRVDKIAGRLGQLGTVRHDLSVQGDGGADFPSICQRVAEIAVGFGVVRPQRNRLPICIDGLIQLPLVLQKIPEVVVSVGVSRRLTACR